MTIKQVAFGVMLSCWIFIGFAADKPYQNNAIALTIPDEWHITEKDIQADYGYLILEKSGFNSSGVVTLAWSDDNLYEAEDADSLSDWAKESTQGWQFIGTELSAPMKKRYGQFQANAINAKTRFLFMPFEMVFYNFHAGHYSISVLTTSAKEDRVNQTGFDTIERTLQAVESGENN